MRPYGRCVALRGRNEKNQEEATECNRSYELLTKPLQSRHTNPGGNLQQEGESQRNMSDPLIKGDSPGGVAYERDEGKGGENAGREK